MEIKATVFTIIYKIYLYTIFFNKVLCHSPDSQQLSETEILIPEKTHSFKPDVVFQSNSIRIKDNKVEIK
jgi:hypothetical protein